MAESILIEIDLDSGKYTEGLSYIEDESISTARKIEIAFNQKIIKTVDKTAVSSFDNLGKKIEEVGLIASKLSVGLATAVPVLLILERHFGTLTKLFNYFGLSFDDVSKRIVELRKTMVGLVDGTSSINDLKISIAGLLSELGIISPAAKKAITAIELYRGAIDGANASTQLLTATAGVFGIQKFLGILKNLKGSTVLINDISKLLLSSKGLFGLTSSLAILSASFLSVSQALETSNSSLTRFAGKIIYVTGIILGGISAAIGFAIIKIAELSQELGTRMVGVFQNASTKFAETTSSVEIFTASLSAMNMATENAAGFNEDWQKTIDDVATSLNFSTKEVTKAAQEIVLVGTQLGLTSEQMMGLTRISAEYAKINKKDVFETSVALTSALNGNAQAVQALGIKLSQASVQQFALKNGITESLESMTEAQLVQLRYNKLLGQYSDVAGIGAIAANSLGDQQNKLNALMERFMASLGAGARIIEDNNLLIFGLNKVLSLVSEEVLAVTGFFGALGARILQIGGFLLGITFKFYAAIKAIKLLDVLLKSDIGDRFLSATIPGINKSLDQLIARSIGVTMRIRSLDDLMKAASRGGAVFYTSVLKTLFGVSGEGASFFGVLRGAIVNVASAFSRLSGFLLPILPLFTKVALVVGVVYGAYKTLESAVVSIERRTGLFTSAWQILTDTLSEGSSVFAPIQNFFSTIIDKSREFASKGVGFITFGIAKIFDTLAALAEKNPFNVFSQNSIAKITELRNKLNGFNEDLRSVAFDISKLPGDADRAIAGVAQKSTVNLEQLVGKLNSIRESFKDFGLTDVEKIKRNQSEALETLRVSYENGLIAESEYLSLREKINLDANQRIAEANQRAWEKNNKTLIEANKMIRDAMARAISSGIQNVISSLAKGESVFKNFADFVLTTFGDLAIQLGQFYIAQGLANATLLKQNPGAQIAAGAALVALGSILKSFFSKGLSGAGGGGGVAPVGAEPFPGQTTTPDNLADPNAVQERQQPSTNVNIQVQGSLVHQEELGEFITKTLNESFGKQGVVLTDARFA